ncbi:hypothetical protein PR003_g3860 [Phytophthora rubi]|uniref:Uncharacterized protein n=1 Tax=Phytophthora rubi TaxID=129364 RepID=A0A6A4FXJ7_9STRA|nr:hypothetical protein PR003_g3860 [Phytophthora rubi]
MLRLVASVRSRLLRAGVVRAAGVVAHGAPRLGVKKSPFLCSYEAPRLSFSSDARGGSRSWETLAVNDPVAWQEAVKPSLVTFLELKKHLMVPIAFVVPRGDEAWPRAAWGYPLGKYAAWLRKRWRDGGNFGLDPTQRKELDEMPFAWDWSQYKWDRFVLPALRRFYELNGHTDVAGFVWDFYEHQWSDRIMPALETFQRLKGHCRVPNSFVVPSDENWPIESWDLRIGSVVSGIRSQGIYSTQVSRDKTRLEELGFVWDFYEHQWSDRIMPALETFQRLKGHCRVPKTFVVPSDENWPMESWDLRIGTVVSGIRSQGNYSTQVTRDKARLEELGFVWDFFEHEWSDRIMPALETFQRLKGHCRVPRFFVVPSDENWPTKSWGLKIGNVVSGIRSKGNYSTQVSRDKTLLEELGFVCI